MNTVFCFCFFFWLCISSVLVNAQSKTIKSIKYESFSFNIDDYNGDSLYFNGDTAFTLDAIEQFNERGNLISRIEYTAIGKKSKEDRHVYNSRGQLEKSTFIEYYGQGDRLDYNYAYDERDSLVKLTILEDDTSLFLTIIYERDILGNVSHQTNIHEGNSLNQEIKFEYNAAGQLAMIRKYNDSIQYSLVEKKYDSIGQLIEEVRVGEDLGWSCPDTCHNYFFYNATGYVTLAKYNLQNDSSYYEYNYDYYPDGQLKEIRSIGKGCIRCTLSIDKYDPYGNLTSRERIRESEEYTEGWYYEYTYDPYGNWIIQVGTHDNNVLSRKKRNIEYY